MEEKKSNRELAIEYANKGMTSKEIASLLGLSETTVKTYLSRGGGHGKTYQGETNGAQEAQTEPQREPEKTEEKKYILAMAQYIKDLCGARDACQACRYKAEKTCFKVFLGASPEELTPEFIIERFKYIYRE